MVKGWHGNYVRWVNLVVEQPMLKDASYRQVIQKFSFIDSLSVSRLKNRHSQISLEELSTDLAFAFQQHKPSLDTLVATETQPQPQSAAIVSASEEAATIDTNWYKENSDYSLSLSEILYSSADDCTQSDNSSRLSSKGRYCGKMLFALACGYSLFAFWWLFGHYGSRLMVMISGGQQVVLPKSEVKFIDYMERSLANLERKSIDNRKEQEEVIYIPVYTPASPVPQAADNIPLANSHSNTATVVSEPAPPQPLAIPTPPPLPSPTPVSSNLEKQETAGASSTVINHTLTGVLELGGDRSAALVKVRGKTRRVWVGEEIHADDWILESIGNQRATISRQGQVRSISVGETF